MLWHLFLPPLLWQHKRNHSPPPLLFPTTLTPDASSNPNLAVTTHPHHSSSDPDPPSYMEHWGRWSRFQPKQQLNVWMLCWRVNPLTSFCGRWDQIVSIINAQGKSLASNGCIIEVTPTLEALRTICDSVACHLDPHLTYCHTNTMWSLHHRQSLLTKSVQIRRVCG